LQLDLFSSGFEAVEKKVKGVEEHHPDQGLLEAL